MLKNMILSIAFIGMVIYGINGQNTTPMTPTTPVTTSTAPTMPTTYSPQTTTSNSAFQSFSPSTSLLMIASTIIGFIFI